MTNLVIFALLFVAIMLEQAWRIEDDRVLQKQIDELRKEIEKGKHNVEQKT